MGSNSACWVAFWTGFLEIIVVLMGRLWYRGGVKYFLSVLCAACALPLQVSGAVISAPWVGEDWIGGADLRLFDGDSGLGIMGGFDLPTGMAITSIPDSFLEDAGLLTGGDVWGQPSLEVPSLDFHVFSEMNPATYIGTLLLLGEEFSIDVSSLGYNLSEIRLLGDGELLHSFSSEPEVKSVTSPDGAHEATEYHFSDKGAFSPGQLAQVSGLSMEVERMDGSTIRLAPVVVPEPSAGLCAMLSAGVLLCGRRRGR